MWTQTLLAPTLTSALYIVVFGYGLGSRIREVEGVPYLEFILPGLILLAVITGVRQHLLEPLRRQARALHRRRPHKPDSAVADGPGLRLRRRVRSQLGGKPVEGKA